MRLLIISLILFVNGNLFSQALTDDNMKPFHVIIVSIGNNYDSLATIGKKVAKELNVEYKTLDRIYDNKRGIILPDTSPDEIFAGEYYPRRYEGSFVSVEHRGPYDDKATSDMEMVVIAGIFEQKNDAQQLFKKVKKVYPAAKLVSTKLFIGCLH